MKLASQAQWHWHSWVFSVKTSGNYCHLWTLQAADQIKKLYDLFLKVDATQVEVNPLGETPQGQGTVGFIKKKVFVYIVCPFLYVFFVVNTLKFIWIFSSPVEIKLSVWLWCRHSVSSVFSNMQCAVIATHWHQLLVSLVLSGSKFKQLWEGGSKASFSHSILMWSDVPSLMISN